MQRRTKILLCVLACAAPILAAEAWVRSLDRRKTPMMDVGPQPSRVSADPRVRYENRPGAVQTHRYFDRDGKLWREIRIVINAQGFRGHEVELAKPPGTFRIAAIGDSQTYGSGVQEDETWPAVLERTLAGKTGEQRVEVMNCAVGGYDTEQEAAALETQWLAYDPDLVLLGFFVNDPAMAEPAAAPSGAPATADGRAETRAETREGAAATVPGGEGRSGAWLKVFTRGRPGFLGWLRKRSQLVDFVCDGAYSKFLVREWVHGGETLFSDDYQGWARTRIALARARDLAEAHGAHFAVVLLPFLVRWDEGVISTKPYAKVSGFCRGKGIACLDLEPAFAGMDVDHLRVHERDWHTGPEGHRVQAAAIADWILTSGILSAKLEKQ